MSILDELRIALNHGDKDAIDLVLKMIAKKLVVDMTNEEIDLVIKVRRKGYEA